MELRVTVILPRNMGQVTYTFLAKITKTTFWRPQQCGATASAAFTAGQGAAHMSGEGVPARPRAGEGGIMVRWSGQNTKNHAPAACGGGVAAASRGIGAGPACASPATRPACRRASRVPVEQRSA